MRAGCAAAGPWKACIGARLVGKLVLREGAAASYGPEWCHTVESALYSMASVVTGGTDSLAVPSPVGSQVSITSACLLPFLSSAAFFWPALSSLMSLVSVRPYESDESERLGRVFDDGDGGRFLLRR